MIPMIPIGVFTLVMMALLIGVKNSQAQDTTPVSPGISALKDYDLNVENATKWKLPKPGRS